MSEQRTARDVRQEAARKSVKERRALLLEAIELADAENDVDFAFSTRRAYIDAAHNDPNPLMMIAHYGWCLARHDEDPERFPVFLWNYKWVLEAAPKFAGVNRRQLIELGEDMTRRFEAAGASKGPAGVAACSIAASLGDLEGLAVAFASWKDTPRTGRLNDCSACDIASEARFLMVLGRHQDAIDAAQPLISGRSGCATQPHYAFGDLLVCSRAVGDSELAADLSHRGRELVGTSPDFTQPIGHHLRHLAITKDSDQTVALLERVAIPEEGDDRSMFDFYRGARLALRLADENGIEFAQLHDRIDGQAEQIGARFDQRNGNSFVSDTIAKDDAEYASSYTS